LYEGLNPHKISAVLVQFLIYVFIRFLCAFFIVLTGIVPQKTAIFFHILFIFVVSFSMGMTMKLKIFELKIIRFQSVFLDFLLIVLATIALAYEQDAILPL